MAEADFFEENCESCIYLTAEDLCGNSLSPYHGRPMVYRDGDEVVQTGWCEFWKGAAEAPESA